MPLPEWLERKITCPKCERRLNVSTQRRIPDSESFISYYCRFCDYERREKAKPLKKPKITKTQQFLNDKTGELGSENEV